MEVAEDHTTALIETTEHGRRPDAPMPDWLVAVFVLLMLVKSLLLIVKLLPDRRDGR